MHHFTTKVAIAFHTIQGLTTLVLQQQNVLDNLVATFIANVGVIGPLNTESIANVDLSTHVIAGRFV